MGEGMEWSEGGGGRVFRVDVKDVMITSGASLNDNKSIENGHSFELSRAKLEPSSVTHFAIQLASQ